MHLVVNVELDTSFVANEQGFETSCVLNEQGVPRMKKLEFRVGGDWVGFCMLSSGRKLDTM